MFVARRADNSIYGAWYVRQWPDQEELANDSPELVAFLNPPPDARLLAIDDNIRSTAIGTVSPKTPAELKAMDWPTFSAWFDANFDTAAKLIGLVKRLTLIIVRRVLW